MHASNVLVCTTTTSYAPPLCTPPPSGPQPGFHRGHFVGIVLCWGGWSSSHCERQYRHDPSSPCHAPSAWRTRPARASAAPRGPPCGVAAGAEVHLRAVFLSRSLSRARQCSSAMSNDSNTHHGSTSVRGSFYFRAEIQARLLLVALLNSRGA